MQEKLRLEIILKFSSRYVSGPRDFHAVEVSVVGAVELGESRVQFFYPNAHQDIVSGS